MATTIGQLAAQVLFRLEENPLAPEFWTLQNEVYSAIVEGCSDLLLLIGRPTNLVEIAYTIAPNQTIQLLPPGMLVVTDIYGPPGTVYKLTLFDLDFTQSSWGSDWENDLSDSVVQWAPLGFSSFIVHPAVSVPQPVTVTGLQLVTTEMWPYDGTVAFPFQDEFMAAVEKYAAAYCQFKEGGVEFQQSLSLYQEYLDDAKRMTEIQDRRDSYIFSRNVGVQTGVPQTTAR